MARISLFFVWITYVVAFASKSENEKKSSVKQIRKERHVFDFLLSNLDENVAKLDNSIEKSVNAFTPKVLFEVKILETSTGKIFENVENHPHEMASEVPKRVGYDTTIRIVKDPKPKVKKINRRIGCGSELCSYEEKYIIPKVIPKNDDTWGIEIFEQDRVEQGFQGQRCQMCGYKDKKKPCSCSYMLRADLKGVCEQKYVNRKMYALLPNGSYITGIFSVPAYCTCKVSSRFKNTSNVTLDRFIDTI